MQEDRWVLAIDEAEIGNGEKKAVRVEDHKLLLVKLDDTFYAISNICPHMGCPLSKGTLEGSVITCACHDWQFDVKSGEFLAAREIKVPVYATRVSENKVLVDLEGVVE